jgi:hypothetical protein
MYVNREIEKRMGGKDSGRRKSEKDKEKMNIEHRTSNTRLPCITNDGGMIIVTWPRNQDILPRPPKGIAGRSNVEWEIEL